MSGISRIFVYGTLMQGMTSEAAMHFQQHADFLEKGSLPGKLYTLGEYPGAHYDSADREYKIHGEIWRMHAPEVLLSWLDRYEEVSTEHAFPTKYVRRILPVAPEDGYHLASYVYLYNRFVSPSQCIVSGKWEGHIE